MPRLDSARSFLTVAPKVWLKPIRHYTVQQTKAALFFCRHPHGASGCSSDIIYEKKYGRYSSVHTQK